MGIYQGTGFFCKSNFVICGAQTDQSRTSSSAIQNYLCFKIMDMLMKENILGCNVEVNEQDQIGPTKKKCIG